MRYATALIVMTASLLWPASGTLAEFQIDADYPGGNIVVGEIDGHFVRVRPDLRDTSTWWFYWNFRVSGAAGKTLRFQFAGQNPIGVRGPAVSSDEGQTWSWLGVEAVDAQPTNASFRYTIPTQVDRVRFAFTIPYQHADLQRFIAPYVKRHRLIVEQLCKTPQDRSVELLRVAPANRQALARVLLTARHHACETMASYVLEGLLASVLSDDNAGIWLRERVEFVVVPIVDKDGVEEGDQGKNRVPHDHWLDYEGNSRYASVAAIREFVARRPSPPLRLAMDLHCSYLREASDEPGSSERVFFMDSMVPGISAESLRFKQFLARERKGPLLYSGRHDLAPGVRWNTPDTARPSFLGWASQLPDIWVATVLEVPYANADGVAVTPESARALGRDLTKAMHVYFKAKFQP